MPEKPIPRMLTSAVFERRLIIVVGSGISKFSADYPLWTTLIDSMKQDLLADEYIDEYFVGDNLDLAELYERVYGRSRLGDKICHLLTSTREVNLAVYEAIAKLEPHIIITTNYDTLLESALDQLKFDYDLAIQSTNLTEWNQSNPLLLKVHGSINDYNSLIITKEDYTTFRRRFIFLSQFLSQQYAFNHVLYLGFSFQDPNFQYLLRQLTWDLWDEKSRKSGLKKSFLLTTDVSKGFEKILQEHKIETLRLPSHEQIIPYLERLSQESDIRTLNKQYVLGCDGIDDYASFSHEKLSSIDGLRIETEFIIPPESKEGPVLSLYGESNNSIILIQYKAGRYSSGYGELIFYARTIGNELLNYWSCPLRHTRWAMIRLDISSTDVVFSVHTGPAFTLHAALPERARSIDFARYQYHHQDHYLNCMFSFFSVRDLVSKEPLLAFDCNISPDSDRSTPKGFILVGLWVHRI
jgi:hypothetical protein